MYSILKFKLRYILKLCQSVLLDASKAFDRVECATPWQKIGYKIDNS